MIKFEKGEFFSGDTAGIVVPDFDEHSGDDLFLNPLDKDCWILILSNFEGEGRLVSAYNIDYEFVPDKHEIGHEYYNMFWESGLTVLFSSYEDALSFIRDYSGPYDEQVEELYDNLLIGINDVGYD